MWYVQFRLVCLEAWLVHFEGECCLVSTSCWQRHLESILLLMKVSSGWNMNIERRREGKREGEGREGGGGGGKGEEETREQKKGRGRKGRGKRKGGRAEKKWVE